MLFSRHTSDDPELSGTIAAAVTVRVLRVRAAVLVLPDPGAVPVPLVQWDLRVPRANPDFKATQVLSDLLELPEPLALPDLPDLSDLLGLPGLPELPEPLALPDPSDLLALPEPLALPDPSDLLALPVLLGLPGLPVLLVLPDLLAL